MRWSVTLSAAAADSLATMRPEDTDAALLAVGRLTQGPTPPGVPRPRPFAAYPGDLILPVSERMVVGYRMPSEHEILVVDFVNVEPVKRAVQPDAAAVSAGVP